MISNKRIMSGFRSTGRLHIGHYFGVIKKVLELQKDNEIFLMIANIQALTDNINNPQKVHDSIIELLKDFYACGIDFKKAHIYIQSEIPEIHEMFVYLANFTYLQKLFDHPTLHKEVFEKNMQAKTPLGFFIYPIHQVADILIVQSDYIPVSIDQKPMIEDAQEITHRLNSYNSAYHITVPEGLYTLDYNIPGIDGAPKMSKSLGNSIYLCEDEECIKKKIEDMTGTNKADDYILKYLDVFYKGHPGDLTLIKEKYIKGGLTLNKIKSILSDDAIKTLKPILEKRKAADKQSKQLLDSVLEETKYVRKLANQTINVVKESLLLDFTR